jgi:hypothetical protein
VQLRRPVPKHLSFTPRDEEFPSLPPATGRRTKSTREKERKRHLRFTQDSTSKTPCLTPEVRQDACEPPRLQNEGHSAVPCHVLSNRHKFTLFSKVTVIEKSRTGAPEHFTGELIDEISETGLKVMIGGDVRQFPSRNRMIEDVITVADDE